MQKLRQSLSAREISALKAFLASPERPEGTLGFHQLQGFLFAMASSPETIRPSEWMPMIGNDEDLVYRDEKEAQTILNSIMALYNQVNHSVLEHSDALPQGCRFNDDVLENFDPDSTISQWSRGFALGHDWLRKVWDEYLPEELSSECGALMMTLSFFSSRKLGEALYAEAKPGDSTTRAASFEQFAETMRELFPSALSEYARLGRTIFEVRMQHASEPVRRTKIGRNEPCPCGSGKKHKKCCGSGLH